MWLHSFPIPRLSIHPSLDPSICPSISPSIHHPFIHPSICPSLHLSMTLLGEQMPAEHLLCDGHMLGGAVRAVVLGHL